MRLRTRETPLRTGCWGAPVSRWENREPNRYCSGQPRGRVSPRRSGGCGTAARNRNPAGAPPRRRPASNGCKILQLFPHTDHPYRQAELLHERERDSPPGGPVELGEHDAVDPDGAVKLARLGECVLPGSGVQHEEGLVGGPGQLPAQGALHLLQLLHQVDLGVQAAGGVDDQNIDLARAAAAAAASKATAAGSAPCCEPTISAPERSGPYLQLRHRGCAEGVAGGQQHRAAFGFVARRQFADGRRLAGAVDPGDENGMGPG